MSYQKFQATQLFTGTELLGPEKVLITDEKGTIETILDEKEAGENIQQLNGVLSPGFINCHCHLELSHLRGRIPEKTGLVDFVFKIVNERHFPEAEILDAISVAEDEMLTNGIVAVGDICNNTLSVSQKTKQKLVYYNFIELTGWLPSVSQMRFEKSLAVYQSFEEIKNEKLKIKNGLSPHAPYSVSNELWELITPYFAGNTVTIHNQETAFEDTLFTKKEGDFMRMYRMMNMDTDFFSPTGKSSLQSYFPKMASAAKQILVHNTFTSEEDVLFVNRQSSDLSWCICINANQYIEQALPPIDLFRKHQGRLVVGTDSLASNWSLSILDELKTITRHFPHIPLAELLQWSTRNGAQALQMDDRLGSFDQGKQPGILLLEKINNQKITPQSTIKRLL
ncbi:MAG TPA: amidohydrolase family protein [Sediminibacterium sp.]